ncbi:hypothetical protein [Haploplasma axanthum]|nr:hypothetical protein [Haploplasma axanthum]
MILNVLALTLLILLTIISFYMIKKDYLSNEKILKGIALFLLIYKSIDVLSGMVVGKYTKYPVEFSAVFYFFFPIVILTNKKELLGAATTGAFISGLGYLVTLVFNINNMVNTHKALNIMPGFILGMLSHSILYFLSVLYMTKYKFNYRDEVLKINIITFIIAIHALFMANFIDYEGTYRFIYLLLSADAIPFFQSSIVLMIIYYPFVLIIYNLAIIFFYRVNKFLYNSYNQKKIYGAEEHYV